MTVLIEASIETSKKLINQIISQFLNPNTIEVEDNTTKREDSVKVDKTCVANSQDEDGDEHDVESEFGPDQENKSENSKSKRSNHSLEDRKNVNKNHEGQESEMDNYLDTNDEKIDDVGESSVEYSQNFDSEEQSKQTFNSKTIQSVKKSSEMNFSGIEKKNADNSSKINSSHDDDEDNNEDDAGDNSDDDNDSITELDDNENDVQSIESKENEVSKFDNLESFLFYKCQQSYEQDLEVLELELEENITEKINSISESMNKNYTADHNDSGDMNDNSNKNNEISELLIPFIIAELTASTICSYVISNITQYSKTYQKEKNAANILPVQQQPQESQRYRKREGVLYKRASFEGTGKLLISGGDSADYTISCDTDHFHLEKLKSKLMKICINDIIFKYNDTKNNHLKFENPRITVTITYNHTIKIINYPNDDNYQEPGSVQRRKYNLSNNRNSLIDKCIPGMIWSKLHLKDERWRQIDLRNYQVYLFTINL